MLSTLSCSWSSRTSMPTTAKRLPAVDAESLCVRCTPQREGKEKQNEQKQYQVYHIDEWIPYTDIIISTKKHFTQLSHRPAQKLSDSNAYEEFVNS